MPKLIKDGKVIPDRWTLLKQISDPQQLGAMSAQAVIVPLDFWKRHRQQLTGSSDQSAVWLDSHETVSELGTDLQELALIALNFPVFSDGRSYTNARELREQLHYRGEVRAIGDVLRDQLFYLSRCGFNAFALRHDQDIDSCLAALKDFHTSYQTTAAEPAPLFRRRHIR